MSKTMKVFNKIKNNYLLAMVVIIFAMAGPLLHLVLTENLNISDRIAAWNGITTSFIAGMAVYVTIWHFRVSFMKQQEQTKKGQPLMITLSARITIYSPGCHSLKDKRMILQSVLTKAKNRFNISIAEVDAQESHQTIIIGMAVVSNSNHHAQNMLDEVIRFIESNTDAEIIKIEFQ